VILIERFFLGHMLVAVASLAIGLANAENAILACSLLIVLLGMAWFASQQRKVFGNEDFLLFLFILSALISFFLGAPVWMLLLGVVASLGAWDLNHFLQRLSRAERVDLVSGLGREHLRRLLLVEAIGLLAGLVAINLQVRITFWWIALLVVLVVIGISRIVVRVRKETGG